jgi:hypothetical protein
VRFWHGPTGVGGLAEIRLSSASFARCVIAARKRAAGKDFSFATLFSDSNA